VDEILDVLPTGTAPTLDAEATLDAERVILRVTRDDSIIVSNLGLFECIYISVG